MLNRKWYLMDIINDKLRFILTFLLSCLVVYAVELGVAHLMTTEPVADSVFNLRTIYQKLITAG